MRLLNLNIEDIKYSFKKHRIEMSFLVMCYITAILCCVAINKYNEIKKTNYENRTQINKFKNK